MEFGLLINGAEVSGSGAEMFDSVDPASGESVGRFARATASDVDAAVAAARHAFTQHWRHVAPLDRGRLLQQIGREITHRSDELARQEAGDCGKPLSQARSDVAVAARYFEFFGNLAGTLSGDHIPISSHVVDFTSREPYGVCGQINAWNFPLNMAARSMAAALAAGNTVVVKTPELAPLTTALLGRIVTEVGLPAGTVNILHGSGSVCGDALSRHPDVNLVTFTGSIATGRKVAAAAATNVVPCVMELGGKSPVVVLADADVELAATQLARAFVEANGQSCDLPSLAIVHESIHDRFVELIAAEVHEFRIGPGAEDPDVGALISATQMDRVESYVASALAEGGNIAVGGRRLALETSGWFYEPTVITRVAPSARVAREEIFGPVLTVLPFSDDKEAVALANGTEYGLAAFVWTRDVGAAMRLTKDIDAGQVYVNCFSSGDSVAVPFGGFKRSGYGREKGMAALHTYTQIKNVCISVR